VTRVAVFTAVDLEARTLARLLGLPALGGGDWPHFAAGALDLIGVGPRARLLEVRTAGLAPPALVVSAGVCGALSPELRAGDLVVPDVVLGPAGERFATVELLGLPRTGALATVTDVVATPAAKARLWVETRALACDMESAAILAWARSRGIPAAVIRGVSDPADRGVPADLAAVVEPDGRVRTARAVRAVLARPRAIADAMTLRSGTSAALKAVARALGRVARERA
jgi:adenosylhomocysteine nucleosidase